MKCYKVTGCSEELRKSCTVWTSFEPESPEMEDIKCWVIKEVYHPDQKAQLAKCKKCTYFLKMNEDCGVSADIQPEMAIIRCEGSLNNDRVKALDKLWVSVKASKKEHVVLDISKVSNIYSCGIGLIVKIQKEMQLTNGMLIVTGVQEFPLRLLSQLHVDAILNLEDSVTAAMKVFDARIQERAEQQRLLEEAERIKNAPRKRMPCWEYWEDHNPANMTGCSECFRKITDNTGPCWVMDGLIEGVSFQYVCEDCIGCSYYEEFKNTVEIQGVTNIEKDKETANTLTQ